MSQFFYARGDFEGYITHDRALVFTIILYFVISYIIVVFLPNDSYISVICSLVFFSGLHVPISGGPRFTLTGLAGQLWVSVVVPIHRRESLGKSRAKLFFPFRRHDLPTNRVITLLKSNNDAPAWLFAGNYWIDARRLAFFSWTATTNSIRGIRACRNRCVDNTHRSSVDCSQMFMRIDRNDDWCSQSIWRAERV